MEISEQIKALNEELKKANLPELALVSPGECKPADMNARYMTQDTMDALVSNLKKDGRLESVPLVFRSPKGAIEIISGHHRIEAAKKAGIEKVLVMVTRVRSKDEAIAKQLSHNAIVGKDDQFTLQKLFDMIGEVDLKMYAGLGDTLKDIGIESLSYTPKMFSEFTIFMTEEEVEHYDEIAKRLEEAAFRPNTHVRVVRLEDENRFRDLMAKVKTRENIKSNAVAFNRLVGIVEEWLNSHGPESVS
ncbi:MAG: ParB/RepB/Spo0J family partition protein [Spirochaetia bacterium]|jgi:hypothetical protein